MIKALPPLDPDSIARLRRRDPDMLRAIVDQHGRRLYRAARSMGCAADTALDIVQDVFVVFLKSLDRFEGRSQVGTWLFGILHHKVQESRRPSAAAAQCDAIDIDAAFDGQFNESDAWIHRPIAPDRWMRSREASAAIQGCLERLTPQQRTVFQLRQVEELSGAEVSGIVGESVNHVGVLFHRARLRLRECLTQKGW